MTLSVQERLNLQTLFVQLWEGQLADEEGARLKTCLAEIRKAVGCLRDITH